MSAFAQLSAVSVASQHAYHVAAEREESRKGSRGEHDGVRISRGVGVGMEVRVLGEEIRDRRTGEWCGGVPSIVRGVWDGREEEDHWVGA